MLPEFHPMLALLLACLPSPCESDEAVARAERIVLARVERVFQERGPDGAPREPHLALVRVVETLVGPAGVATMLVVDPGALPGMARLEAASEALLFLQADTLAPDRGPARLQRLLALAPALERWRRLEELHPLGEDGWLVPVGLVRELEAARQPLTRASLRAALEASLARTLPRLEAHYSSSGPRGSWSVRVSAAGAVLEQGEPRPALAPAQAEALWRELAGLTPATRPFDVWSSFYPCGPSYAVTRHDRTGRITFRVGGRRLAETASQAERDDLARFAALWERLPGAARPALE